ncbi:MAG: lipopolysaccharide biosynthesis protein [Acutalibacteraceae bacterium]
MILSNKYRNLAQNTAIFAIGTFSSKVLVFLMMPIYTRALTTAEYGTVDLIQQISNLLVPIVTLGVTNALIRFGADRSFRKNDVFTTGVICLLGGFSLLLCFAPVIHMISYTSDHTVMLYFFVLMSSARELCSQFSRAKGYVKLFAFDGFLSTLMTCLLTITFLLGFKWGINGYLSAIIVSDALSTMFLFFSARLYQNIKFRSLNKRTFKMMLRFAVPMIPSTLLWWIVSVSDRYVITYVVGPEANGLYAAAYKIPTIIVLVSTIFMNAWQVSAFAETKDKKHWLVSFPMYFEVTNPSFFSRRSSDSVF